MSLYSAHDFWLTSNPADDYPEDPELSEAEIEERAAEIAKVGDFGPFWASDLFDGIDPVAALADTDEGKSIRAEMRLRLHSICRELAVMKLMQEQTKQPVRGAA